MVFLSHFLDFFKQSLGLLLSQQGEAAPLRPQQSFPGHLAQLVGQGAPVHIEVIGQLLPVVGDGEAPAAAADRLLRQVGEEPPPDGAGGGVEDLPGEVQVLLGREGQQVADQPGVVGAGVGADREHPLHRQEQDPQHLLDPVVGFKLPAMGCVISFIPAWTRSRARYRTSK